MSNSDDETTRIIRAPNREELTRILGQDAAKTQRVGDAEANKTRVIGIGRPAAASGQAAQQGQEGAASEQDFNPVTGWIVVIEGPGRGRSAAIFAGNNTVGRGPDNRVRVDFGDESISRDTHAIITFDDVSLKFFLRDTGKANLIRINNELLLQPTEIKAGDQFSIGNSRFVFQPLCGASFKW